MRMGSVSCHHPGKTNDPASDVTSPQSDTDRTEGGGTRWVEPRVEHWWRTGRQVAGSVLNVVKSHNALMGREGGGREGKD